MKITTQFSDNCSNCNDIIREKSIAYRGQHGDLFCINCNDNGITRKKVIQKKVIISKKENTIAPISFEDSNDHSKRYEKKSNSKNSDDWFESAQRVKEQENESKNNYSPIKNSNIFLSFLDFTNIQNRISILNNQNEKKTKKN